MTPALRERGLIKQMEEEVATAGLGEWFNGNLEDIPESWSGPNSDTSETQDCMRVTNLMTIRGCYLPLLVSGLKDPSITYKLIPLEGFTLT